MELQAARRRKERTYPEFVGPRARAKLVVLAGNVGNVAGRWSAETVTCIRLLAEAKSRSEPSLLRRSAECAWRFRWSSVLGCAAARAFVCSLLDRRPNGGADVDTPILADVLQEHRDAGLGRSGLVFFCGLLRTTECAVQFLNLMCAQKKKNKWQPTLCRELQNQTKWFIWCEWCGPMIQPQWILQPDWRSLQPHQHMGTQLAAYNFGVSDFDLHGSNHQGRHLRQEIISKIHRPNQNCPQLFDWKQETIQSVSGEVCLLGG